MMADDVTSLHAVVRSAGGEPGLSASSLHPVQGRSAARSGEKVQSGSTVRMRRLQVQLRA